MMTTEMAAKLRKSLIEHEGYKKFLYFDTAEPPRATIGIGYNISERGLSDDWINHQYLADVTYFYNQLNEFPWYKDLNPDRQIILIDMSFMGWRRFLEFENMIQALSIHNYAQAAYEMLQSEWAKQVKSRSAKLAQGMLSGEYNP